MTDDMTASSGHNDHAILSPAQVREIGERAAKATEGPWEAGTGWVYFAGEYPTPLTPLRQIVGERRGEYRVEDLDFIAHARQDIPALCATVEALREELAELRELYYDAVKQRNDAIYARERG